MKASRSGSSRPISRPMRRDLLRYLQASSSERAKLLGKLFERNPGMAKVLADLESDDDLRVRFEVELLKSQGTAGKPSIS